MIGIFFKKSFFLWSKLFQKLSMDLILCLLSKLGRKSLISKNWHYVPEMQRLRLLAHLAFANRGGLFLHRVVFNFLETPFYNLFSSQRKYPLQSVISRQRGSQEEFYVINNELFKLPRQTTYLQLYLNHSNHTERNNNIMSSTLQ